MSNDESNPADKERKKSKNNIEVHVDNKGIVHFTVLNSGIHLI